MFRSLAALLLLLSPLLLADQDDSLRHAFEGKTVIVKLDMPGDDGGISVFPQREDPIDYRKVSDSIRKYGTALRKGDEVMITKVHIKPKLIEFHLGGGGFGKWKDNWNRPSTPSTTVPKSRREKDLEKERGGATGAHRDRIDRELNSLERQRRYEESRRRDGESAAKDRAQEWEEAKRLRMGSRFNLQFPDGVPPEAATPEGVMAALRQYVDFGRGKR